MTVPITAWRRFRDRVVGLWQHPASRPDPRPASASTEPSLDGDGETIADVPSLQGAAIKKSVDKNRAGLHYVTTTLIAGGDFEGAIGFLNNKVKEARALQDHSMEGEAELLLAGVNRKIGAIGDEHSRLDRQHLDRAERAFREAGSAEGIVRSLSRQIVYFGDQHDRVNADFALWKLELLDNAKAAWLKRFSDATFAVDRAEAISALEFCMSNVGHMEDKERDHWLNECKWKLALESKQPLGETVETDTVRSSLVSALFAGRDDASETHFRQAISSIEKTRCFVSSEVKQRELSETFDPLYHAAAALADRAGRYEDAIDTLELNTSRSLLSRETIRLLWSNSKVQSFEMLKHCNQRITRQMELYLRVRGAGEWRGLQTALHRRRQAVHQIEQQLIEAAPSSRRVFRPSRWSDVRPVLGADLAIVVFSPYGAIYGLDSNGVQRLGKLDTDAFRDTCTAFSGLCANPDAGNESSLGSTSKALARMCVDPLRPFLDRKRRAMVVPYGPLWKIPLGILGDRPLAETHALAYVPNLSMAARLLNIPVCDRRVKHFVGVANPDGSLPCSEEEVAAASSHFYDSTTFTGSACEFREIMLCVGGADIVHLSCHAGTFEEFPECSWLGLGTADDPCLLFAQDIIRMPLQASLVVLAACHAGTSVERPGAEYIGLPGAFLCAGARAVMAPLWEVDDRSTARLMEAFYENLPRLAPGAALWQAQLQAMTEPEAAHPFHWAAFQMFGLP